MNRLARSVLVCCFVVATPLALLGDASGAEPNETSVLFARQIRPILSDKCFACHGPDEKTREADLRLDVLNEALEQGVISPGKPSESELLRRISLPADDEERMPPKNFHKELDEAEVELFREWIAQGAPHEQHWSYQPLQRPPIPDLGPHGDPPASNPIDAFLLDALRQQDLGFSVSADKITLIRRLYLDLLGLPPTQEELQEALNDTSSDAKEHLVDKLLRDHRFGERLAVYWLDLVRYADTIGYHSDNYMEVSAYRDYVIRAFNENKPFDQFTIEQLAGDLLPDPSEEQLIASGYNRLLQTTEEGGAQAKEYFAIYAADRVRNVSGVWMGQTVGCAQCHDHKYDPFTTRDFYSLAAFFADIDENAVGRRAPNYTLIGSDEQQKLDALNKKVASLRIDQRLLDDSQLAEAVAKGQAVWEQATLQALESSDSLWRGLESIAMSASGGVVLKLQEDGSLLSTGENPGVGSYTVSWESADSIEAIRLEVFPDASFPNQKGFSRANGNFVLTEVKVFCDEQPVPIVDAIADYEQGSWPVKHAIDNRKKTGWAVDGHQKPADRHVALFRLGPVNDGKTGASSWRIELHHDSVHEQHLIGRFRLSTTDQPAAGLDDKLSLPDSVTAVLATPAKDRSDEQIKILVDHYRSFAPELDSAKRELTEAEKELASFKESLQTMLISKSLTEPRMTRVLPRGNWLDDSGEVVQPEVPSFLPHEPIEGRRATRLDLAQWLVSKNNPLTSRNLVNRLWKLFFGRGLSRNLDDLGGQGEAPTHPELLDWLAVEFQDSGWDIKHMVRLMVTSNAYAQSSVVTPEMRSKDPLNLFYTRQNRWRLEAEFVRDTALSVSGLLVTDVVGGRSVKPYQPAGYWQHLNFPQREWESDSGANLYRRSQYTFWCRTFLHPSLLAFDAPSREECTADRSRSNIPQQALVLLNDPIFVEAARVFGQRIMKSGDDIESRLTWGIRTALCRDPRTEEIEVLKSLYEQQRSRYAESPDDAKALLNVGAANQSDSGEPVELAAWAQVARALLNAYETTSRF